MNHTPAVSSCLELIPSTALWSWRFVFATLVFGGVNVLMVVGNLLVVVAVCTDRALHTTTNVLITSLAVSDLLLGLLILPLSISHEALGQVWIFGSVLCDAWLAADVWLCTASIYNLVAVSFDRYMAVTQPLRYRLINSRWLGATLVFVSWLISFLICLPPVIINMLYIPSPVADDLSFDLIDNSSIRQMLTVGGDNRSSALEADALADVITETLMTLPHDALGPTCQCSPSNNDSAYVIYSSFGSFFIPFFLIIALNLGIYRVARHVGKALTIKPAVGRKNGSGNLAGKTPNASPPTTMRVNRGPSSVAKKFSTESSAFVSNSNGASGSSDGARRSSMPSVPRYWVQQPRKSAGTATAGRLISTLLHSVDARGGTPAAVLRQVPVLRLSADHRLTAPPSRCRRKRHATADGATDIQRSASPLLLQTLSSAHNSRRRSNNLSNPVPQPRPCARSSRQAAQTPPNSENHDLSPSCTCPVADVRREARLLSASSTTSTCCSLSATPPLVHLAPHWRVRRPSTAATPAPTAASSTNSLNVVPAVRQRSRSQQPTPVSLAPPPGERPSGSGFLSQLSRTAILSRTAAALTSLQCAEARVAKTVGIVVGVFSVCWLPFSLAYLLQAYDLCPIETCIPASVFNAVFWLGYCNSALNPVIYALFSRDFRRAFRRVLVKSVGRSFRHRPPSYRHQRPFGAGTNGRRTNGTGERSMACMNQSLLADAGN